VQWCCNRECFLWSRSAAKCKMMFTSTASVSKRHFDVFWLLKFRKPMNVWKLVVCRRVTHKWWSCQAHDVFMRFSKSSKSCNFGFCNYWGWTSHSKPCCNVRRIWRMRQHASCCSDCICTRLHQKQMLHFFRIIMFVALRTPAFLRYGIELDQNTWKWRWGAIHILFLSTFDSTAEAARKSAGRDRITAPPLI